MATINDVKKRVFFSQQSYYDTMVANGSVTVDGVTYPYSPNDTDYFTPYNSGHNYSTSEQVIGTWINNKPLYEKTIVVNLTSAYMDIPLADKGINNIEFATVTEVTLIDDEGLVFPLNMVYQSGSTIDDVQFTSAYMAINGSNSSFDIDITQTVSITLPATVYATLHYTKSTD